MSIDLQRSSSTGAHMQPELAGMLAAIEAGDAPVIGMLADWLEERGDPRAPLARATTQIDVEAVADTLYLMRAGDPGDGPAGGILGGLIGIALGGGTPLEAMPLDTAVSREECLHEVRAAIDRKKLTPAVVRAITVTRRAKINQLLELFKRTPAAS
jgi:hypothetical protein